MANLSRDIYSKARRIKKVLFQDQTALSDFELNELQDILEGFRKDLQLLGGGVGPVGEGFAVEATGVANTLTVKAGLYITSRSILYLDEDYTITGLSTPGGARSDLVYLSVLEDEKTEVDFPNITNPVTGEVQAHRMAFDISVNVWEDTTGALPSYTSLTEHVELAILNRVASAVISTGEINDTRARLSRTYFTYSASGSGRVTDGGGLTVDVESSVGSDRGTAFSAVATAGLALTDNTVNYVRVDDAGTGYLVRQYHPFFAQPLCAKVTTSGGAVTAIEDLRVFEAQDQLGIRTTTAEADIDALELEVTTARGSESSLDTRLDASLEEDGTLVEGAVDTPQLTMLRPHESSPAAMTVDVEAGEGNYGSATLSFAGGTSPTFTAPAANDRIDLLYLDSTGSLAIQQGVESATPAAPSHEGKLPIAQVLLTTAHVVIQDADITDVRPFLNLGGGEGSGDVYTRLLIKHGDSVYARGILDPLDDEDDLGGSSDGTWIEPGNYLLANGEILETAFTAAPTGAASSIPQVGILVLAKQELDPADLTVEVNDGNGYETVTTWYGIDGNHSFSSPAGNVLNLKVTNASGGDVNIEGYGIFFENEGGASGFVDPKAGLSSDSSGLVLMNANPAAMRMVATDFAFTWDAANDRLSWGAATGSGDDLTFEITDYTNGTVTQTLTIASSPLNSVIAGSYVYFDMDRVSASVTPQVSAGPPDMAETDRFLLGRRVTDANGGNDNFVMFDGTLLRDITNDPTVSGGAVYPQPAFSAGILKYIALSGGTAALSYANSTLTPATYTYNIADFTGVGISTSKIRGLFIRFECQSNQDEVYGEAEFPDGTLQICSRIDQHVGGDDRHDEQSALVPVNEGQVSLDIKLTRTNTGTSGGTAAVGFFLFGAWQVG